MSKTKKYQCFNTKLENYEIIEKSLKEAARLRAELEMIFEKCGEYEEHETIELLRKEASKIHYATCEICYYMDGVGYYDPVVHPLGDDAVQYSKNDMTRAKLSAYLDGSRDMQKKYDEMISGLYEP